MPRRHKEFFKGLDADRWRTAVAALEAELPKLDGVRVAGRLAELAALRGDAHTVLVVGRLPEFAPAAVEFGVFPDGIIVTAIDAAHAAALGKRVTQIDGRPVADVVGRVARLEASENQQGRREQLERLLASPGILYAAGVLSSPNELSLQTSDGSTMTLPRTTKPVLKRRWLDLAVRGVPLYLHRTNEPYWYTELPAHQAIYLAYNRCFNDPNRPFPDVFAEFRKRVETARPERLVIDLRHNAGGNSEVLRPLLSWLTGHPVYKQPGRTAVLIGRRTYSSGMMNAYQLRDRAGATLVGEPTGGKPNAFGEVKQVVLPRSHILLGYSTKYFQDVPGDPASIEPAVRVMLTAVDYLAGRDPVMEAALALPISGPPPGNKP